MSQRAVERAVGKLVTDEEFRGAFFASPAAACRNAGLELTADELSALGAIPRGVLGALCACLDDRICRLWVPQPIEEAQR